MKKTVLFNPLLGKIDTADAKIKVICGYLGF